MDPSHGIDTLQIWMWIISGTLAVVGALAAVVWNSVRDRLGSVEITLRTLEVRLAKDYIEHDSVREIVEDLRKQLFDRLDRQDRDLGEKLRDLSSRLDRQASAVSAFYGRHMDNVKGEPG